MNNYILSALVSLIVFNTVLAEEVTLVVKEYDSDKYIKLVVDSSEVDAIIESEIYQSVEKDIWVKSPAPVIKKRVAKSSPSTPPKSRSKSSSNVQSTDQEVPNDPDFQFQYYFQDKSLNQGSSEIFKAMGKSEQNKKLRIALIDGGFEDHEDMEWAYGYNFFDHWGEVRGPEYRDLTDEQKECSGGHGLGVASIIGAKSNNGIGISGVVDAEMIALRALSCGIGPLSGVAEAILHAAGAEVDDIPAIPKVDLINISISGELESCPSYLQDAIDYANDKGIMIFVAAGNLNIDANGAVPAQCTGVFVTGATEQDGYKTSFSNFGSKVDVMAAGMDVLGYASNGVTGWWEGTSQASPLALGIAALGLQHNPDLSRDELFTYLKVTASSIRKDVPSAEQDCSNDRCGAGLLNADTFMNYVVASANGGVFKLRHALSPESTCSQELFISNLGNKLPICQMHELVIADGEGLSTNEMHIVRVVKGEAMLEENAEFIVSTYEKVVLLDYIDVETYEYGVKVCSDELCKAPIIKIETDEVILPSACQ
ncbi:S8 family peptidase [Thalassotalea piscium]